jgi:VCBS repeat-containing protein
MLSRKLRSLLGSNSRTTARKNRRRRLQLESLEARQLLATIPVTTTADVIDAGDGLTSLREAVILANSTAGDDEIRLSPGNYVLGLDGLPDDAAARGDLDVTDTVGNLTIQGSVSGAAVIDADGIDRVFHVLANADLTLRDVVVQGGEAEAGGGILNAGRLTVIRSHIRDNHASERGGGIETSSILNVEQSRFVGNRTGDPFNPAIGGLGGAINNSLGNVGIDRTQFIGNTAGLGAGGAINSRSGTVQVDNSTFQGNQAGDGGAVATVGGNAFLNASTFTQNQALKNLGRGGAVDGRGEVYIRHSTLHDNSAGQAGAGGAVANGNFMHILNSTISGNTAGISGAHNASLGGGIYNLGNLNLHFSTVVHNVQIGGGISGGIYNHGPSANTRLLSSIVALNGLSTDNAPDFGGNFTSLGGNVIGKRTGANGTFLISDRTGTVASPLNPQIGPLADNGGPTLTHALLPGSPAIDRGVVPVGTAVVADQRFLPRPGGPAHDSGAYEVQPQVPGNTAPVGNADSYTFNEDSALAVSAAQGLLANDTDVQDDPLAVHLESGPGIGTLDLRSDGSFDYQPPADFFGLVTFTYRAFDGELESEVTLVSLNVEPVNDAPVAVDDSATTNEESFVFISVLANDSDAEDNVLAVTSASQGQHGAVEINGDNTLTYTPHADFHGTDSFSYSMHDGNGGSASATVNVTVLPVNDRPTAAIDSATTNEDGSLSIDVLANDSDVDGDVLVVTSVEQGANGSVTINADGTVTYTPKANFHGSDSFNYSISDGNGGTSGAFVQVTVQPVNDVPVAVADEYSMDEDTLLSIAASVGLLANDSDIDDDLLSAIVADLPDHGSLSLNPNGSFTYQPDPDFFGSDSFTYRASDGTAQSDPVTVTISVRDVSEIRQVEIDIQPGDSNNAVNSKSNISVAILSSATFDARDVDISSLRFGRTGDEDSLVRHKKTNLPKSFRWEDVNGDGRLDLIVQFDADLTGLVAGDTEAHLTGRLSDGTALAGSDEVAVKSHPGKGRKK